jgi:hypothetical protein
MTPRYRELMTKIIAKEINRVYRLFGNRNPEFFEKGKVSIFGHSLGVSISNLIVDYIILMVN